MEKISWADCVENEGISPRVKEKRNILHTVNRRKGNWIGHISCRNCLLKLVIIEGEIEGRIEVMERRERRSKQLLVDVKEKRRGSTISHCVEKSL
jgi:hypothetical protein